MTKVFVVDNGILDFRVSESNLSFVSRRRGSEELDED